MLECHTGVEVGDTEMVTKEVWVTSCNDGVGEKKTSRSVVGVESVALLWVVAKNHIGLHNANESH